MKKPAEMLVFISKGNGKIGKKVTKESGSKYLFDKSVFDRIPLTIYNKKK